MKIVPRNQKENQDIKSAELNNSVWQFIREKQNMKIKTQQMAKDYIDLGEVAAKLFWNPNAGKFLGYRAEMDEAGNPVMDDAGQMVASKTPVFSGDLQIERIYAFNLLRDPSAKSMEESKYFILRKMVDLDDAKALVAGDEEKLAMIKGEQDDTFLVFDGNQQNYQKSENQIMFKEYYFRPCTDYPMGYFYIAVEGGILFEGELPFGIFPIIYEGFDEIQTSPRHRSIVKQLRPYQAEINRSASKIAEHQVTLGDDKILIQSGTKITTGIQLPGVRSIQYSGMTPTVLAGRAGEQYAAYMASQIKEMYDIANIDEDMKLKDMAADPFGQLFASVHDKKKFTIYSDKFENFLCSMCRIGLDLARRYLPEDMVIPMIGRTEMVNISEFKTTNELCYNIKVEPMTDDITTMMGRQLSINHALQYIGGKLDKEDIGKLMKQMPFGNFDASFDDMTINYDSAMNLILALDRGEQPMPNKNDDAIYMSKKLIARTRMSDFQFLSDEIKNNYATLEQMYNDIHAENMAKMKMAESQFIPSGGARIKVDYYVPDPKNPDRPVRATLPAESVDWLIKNLASQGSAQEQLATLGEAGAAAVAGQFNQQQGAMLGAGSPMPQQGPPMPSQGLTGRRILQ